MNLEDLLAHVENDQRDLMVETNTPEVDPLEDIAP